MQLHYLGLTSLFLFFLYTVFVLAGFYLLHTALGIICRSFLIKTGKNIFYPLFFVTAFPILMILYRQSVSLGLLTFHNPDIKVYIDIATQIVPLFCCLLLLFYILKKAPTNLVP